jgi:hypothetical protein
MTLQRCSDTVVVRLEQQESSGQVAGKRRDFVVCKNRAIHQDGPGVGCLLEHVGERLCHREQAYHFDITWRATHTQLLRWSKQPRPQQSMLTKEYKPTTRWW